MKSTDKNLSQNKENSQSSDTWLYVLLFITFAVLVGGLVWYWWSPGETNRKYDYESVLGKYSTSPTEKEVSQLISDNQNRVKVAKRVLADQMKGRKLTAKQKKEVEDELKNYKEDIGQILQNKSLKGLEKNDPETLAQIYDILYKQGEVTVRLKDKTSIGRSNEEIKKQEEIQSEWLEKGITEQEEAEIKAEIDKWITKWYNQAKVELIGSEPGKYPLLTDGVVVLWDKGEKIEEPTRDQINKYRKVKEYWLEGEPAKKTVDFSKNLDIKFNGYYGFLTEEDKKGSSEGKETYGLTKSDGASVIWKCPLETSLDKKGENPAEPVSSNFFLVHLFNNNHRNIKIGFEKKMFFNRLGHEEWLNSVEYDDKKFHWNYTDICFEECVETMAHELAHAIVNTTRANYDGERGGGHGVLFDEVLKKIEKMIKDSPDFPEFKTWWEKPEAEQKEWSRDAILVVSKENHWDTYKYWYLGGGIALLSVGGLIVVLLWDGGRSSPKKHAKN